MLKCFVGIPWFSLHRTLDVLGWLAYCFCGYAAFLLVWTCWKGRRPKHAARWMKFVEGARKLSRKTKERGAVLVDYSWHISLLFALVVTMGMTYGVSINRWPVEVRHNVRIVSHPSQYQWQIVSDEKPEGEMYYACPWMVNREGRRFDANESWIVSGYFAREAVWQVQGDCNSIRDQEWGVFDFLKPSTQELGFFYSWKPDGKARTNKEMGYE